MGRLWSFCWNARHSSGRLREGANPPLPPGILDFEI
jgi:hypothetical protein